VVSNHPGHELDIGRRIRITFGLGTGGVVFRLGGGSVSLVCGFAACARGKE